MVEALLLCLGIMVCLTAEAFFSGTETGMISLNRVRLRHRADEGDPRAIFLMATLENPDSLLATTLVGTNLAVVSGTALATKLFSVVMPGHTALLVSCVMIPTIVVVGELIPKAVFRRRSMEILLPAVPLIRGALFLLAPPARAIGWVSRQLLEWAGGDRDRSPFVTREELRHLIKAGVREGTLAPGQQRMLHGAFSFAATSVKEVMIPLTEMVAVPEGTTAAAVLDRARATAIYRFPVYRERIDQIVGVVNASDLLYGDVAPGESIAAWTRPPLYLPNTATIDVALFRMQREHEPVAVIVDEYGGCDGLVTVQEIIEQVVGELDTSHDAVHEITVLSPSTFQLDAHVDLDVLNDELGLNLPKQGYETLAGFLLSRFQRIPREGEQLTWANLRFEVLSLKGPTIDKVHLRIRK